MHILMDSSELPIEVSEGGAKEIFRLREENERLRIQIKTLKQAKTCKTCARERDSSKCNNCALYYYRKPCQWIPARIAIDAAKEQSNEKTMQ